MEDFSSRPIMEIVHDVLHGRSPFPEVNEMFNHTDETSLLLRDQLERMLAANPQAAGTIFGIDDVESFDRYHKRNRILKDHQELLEQDLQNSVPVADNQSTDPLTDEKQTMSTNIPRNSTGKTDFMDIQLKNLKPETTYPDRVLCGKLIVEPIITDSVLSVIEDDYGDVARISFKYDGTGQNAKQQMKSRVKCGTKVMIKNPGIKLFPDGHLKVYIGDTGDFTVKDPVSEGSAGYWKDEALRLFIADKFSEATPCFNLALSKWDANVTAVLNNISATLRIQSDNWSALHYAFAATCVAPSSCKAKYRVAQALEAVEEVELAIYYCGAALALSTGGTVLADMKARLLEARKAVKSKPSSDTVIQILTLLAKNPLTNIKESSSTPVWLSLVEHKERGNKLYQNGEFEGAVLSYHSALKTTPVIQVAELLVNISANALAENKFIDAATSATASDILHPGVAVVNARRIGAFSYMEMPEIALVISQAPQIKDDPLIIELRRRIEKSLAEGTKMDILGKLS